MADCNVLLPFLAPTTKSLREAVRNIILDIQRDTGETDHETAERLGISIGTLRNARDRKNDLGSLTIAKIGHEYGEEAVEPYHALYARIGRAEGLPITELAEAVAALSRATSAKSRMDALPACKAAMDALGDFVTGTERERLRLVS